MTGPQRWNQLGALPSAGPEEPKLGSGVPAVIQRVQLRTDEYVCAGCKAPVYEAAGELRIQHLAGCEEIAALIEQVRRGT